MRIARWIACLLVAVIVGSVTAPGASAGEANRAEPTDAFCTALGDFFDVAVQLAYLTVFEQIDAAAENDDGDSDVAGLEEAPVSVRSQFVLVLSPRLERLSRELAGESGKPLKALFRRQAKVFGDGVDILRDGGFTAAALEIMAMTPPEDSDEAAPDVLGELGITDADIERLATDFEPNLVGVDLFDVPRREQIALQRAGSQCGVATSAVDCSELLPESEATEILGDTVALVDDQGCVYEGPEAEFGTAPRAELSIFEGSRPYDTRVGEVGRFAMADSSGDDATTFEGFHGFNRSDSCGRTIVAHDGNHTVQLAVCRVDDGEITDATLTALAALVLSRA